MATQFTGLLGDVLGYMQDPNRTQALQGIGGLLQSGLTSIDESQNKWRELQARAFGDKKNPMKVTDQAAFDQLTEMTMAGPMAFAPAGMTKAMKAPQQAALDLAQKRAALPVEQGGLGLPASNTAADRAKAMGFDVEAYHGTASKDIQKFMPEGGTQEGEKTLQWYKNRQAQNKPVGYMSFRSGSFFSPKPDYAGSYAPEGTGVMYPVNLRMDNPLSLLPNAQGRYAATNAPDINKTIDAMILQDSIDKSINEIAIIDPAQIRSRFAAFDPFRKDVATATAMGVALLDLLAAEPTPEELKRRQSSGLLFP